VSQVTRGVGDPFEDADREWRRAIQGHVQVAIREEQKILKHRLRTSSVTCSGGSRQYFFPAPKVGAFRSMRSMARPRPTRPCEILEIGPGTARLSAGGSLEPCV